MARPEYSTVDDMMGDCIHDVFARRAAEYGTNEAVRAGVDVLTYRNLDERSNRLAHRLHDLGVQPGQPVAVLLDRSIDLIVALLAVIKAGGAYLPLDPLDPAGRLERILTDARAEWVVTRGRWERSVPGDITVIHVDTDQPATPTRPAGPPRIAMTPDDLAYICFTSGSTGIPKGVCVPHRGVVRLAQMADYSAADTFLQVAPLAFDASVFEIWCALLNGARLVLYPPQPPTPDGLARLITEERISVALLATGLFHRMVDGPVESLASLRHLLVGGDVLSPRHAHRARQALPGIRFSQVYGVAEATCLSSCHDIVEPPPLDRTVPIGRPLPGTRLYVLDDDRYPCDVGVIGELYIGGEGLAHGYLGLPELTAQRFLPDRFRPGESARMYATGDLASLRTDGSVEFHGRRDSQIKIRGYRVELGEIEAFLAAQSGIGQAVAVARQRGGTSADRQVVAYVTTASTEPSGVVISRLRAVAHQKLPPYLVPSTILVLDEIPMSGNGKIDRDALPEPPTRVPRQAASPYTAPRSRLELLLAELVGDVLGIDGVGVLDDFVELGGDSLAATDLAAQIRRALDLREPPWMVFTSWTVAQLAEAMSGNAAEDCPHATG